MPDGIRGHFGPELRRLALMQYHQGQVTVERLVAQLQAIGVSISKRRVMRLLIGQQEAFLSETGDVLRAGLQTAGWISVDDTGARHRAANAVCTQIGDDDFAWFATTGSKIRLNFLDLLRACHTNYAINDAAWMTCATMIWPARWCTSWRPSPTSNATPSSVSEP